MRLGLDAVKTARRRAAAQESKPTNRSQSTATCTETQWL